MLRYILPLFFFVFAQGCGTENPFDRGPDLAENGSSLPTEGESVSFSQDVVSILSACTGCHASGAGGWTYNGGAGAHASVLGVIDRGDPENSLLLVKATGGNGHGGGRVIAPSGTQYQALLAWIRQGALNN